MVKDFRLELNNQGVYTVPGEVTGNVVVVTDESKSYNAISVSLRGYADVHWSETYTVTDRNGHTHTRTRHYHSHEDYLNDVIVVWNHDQSPNRALNPGQYVFPFRFTLNSCPSSFVGQHGHIRYEVGAKISTGLFHFDEKINAVIQVVDKVDINLPALMNPVQHEDEKTICCLCCASAPISLTVNVPRTGFCIGEGIPLTASLDNGSTRVITLRAILSKTVTFRAQGSTRVYTERLNSFESPPVQGRTTFQWAPAEQLAIRSAIPTIANCSIISLRYTLRVEADIPWALDSEIDIPITLGNVPPQSSAGQPPLPPIQYPTLPTNLFVPYNPNPGPEDQGPPPSAAYPAPPPGQGVPPPGAYPAPPPGQGVPPPGAYPAPPPGGFNQGLPPPGAYPAPPAGGPYQGMPPPQAYPAQPPGGPYQGMPPSSGGYPPGPPPAY